MSGLSDILPAPGRTAVALATLVGLFVPAEAVAVQGPMAPAAAAVAPDTSVYPLLPVVVTATRTAKPVFLTPAPVNLISAARIRTLQANTVTDLFRDLPGLDVAGVGVQQPRPVIRGQRGQRILLLQDAVRLNNSRRQQEFGEIPGVVDLSTVERVEVVRGPSSVLYGTDAIGGVVNIISRTPTRDGVSGSVGYRFGSAGDLHRGSTSLFARHGAWDVQVNAALREGGEYLAPSGTFGAIRLDSATTVFGTGARDRTVATRVGYRLAPNHALSARLDHYEARDAGFGFVDPAAYSPQEPRIDIRYPDQDFRKWTLGYAGTGFGLPVADRAEVTAYLQQNVRNVAFNLNQRLSPMASIDVQQRNFSDVATAGARLEVKKLVAPRVLLTYGVDGFRDRSENTDSSRTVITGFGPPQTTIDRRPQVPNATFRSLGGFVQSELALGRGSVVLGTRVQDVFAETLPTEGLTVDAQTKRNRTVVGSASAIYALTDGVSLLGSVGRGFRSPNLIEWFYDGLTTDGRFYQVRNPELEPETSLSLDAGVRVQRGPLSIEGFVYRNDLRNGIRTVARGDSVNRRPAFQNVNVDELVFEGVELSAEVELPLGFAVNAGHTRQEARDARDPNIPVGDLYSSKTTGALRFRGLADRFWAEYGVRHQGEQRDADLFNNPVGDVLPAFTVHHLRGGLTVFRRGAHEQRLAFTVGNLTDRLYAEAANVSFFRPEPRRHLIVGWEASF